MSTGSSGSSEYQYDLIVIGGGPAGYNGAIRAAKLGLKTAVIEKRKTLGGTCLNVGCIPSKALLASTEHFAFANTHFAKHGIKVEGALSVDIPTLMKRKLEVVSKLVGGIDFLFKKGKIDRLVGLGKLLDPHTVEATLDGGEVKKLTAKAIMIATGSDIIELPFLKFDGDKVVSSDQGIAFESIPKSLIVIGAGAIGLELGSVWSRLGTKVTILEFLPRIAAGGDAEVSQKLQRALEGQGIKIHVATKVESAEVGAKGVTVKASADGKELTFEAEKVLVAIGRKPFTAGLGLETVGIELSKRGRIPVNAHWQTSVPSIYAVGDVIEGPMLAHKAEEEGAAVAERIAGKAGHVNYEAIPNVIYTSPEAASVGATEEQLKEKGIAYRKGSYPFTGNGRALAADTSEGFSKILADAKTDRLLGVHILASNASELIAEAVSVIEFGGSAEDIARTVHAHPTMAEGVKEAAWAVQGSAVLGEVAKAG